MAPTALRRAMGQFMVDLGDCVAQGVSWQFDIPMKHVLRAHPTPKSAHAGSHNNVLRAYASPKSPHARSHSIHRLHNRYLVRTDRTVRSLKRPRPQEGSADTRWRAHSQKAIAQVSLHLGHCLLWVETIAESLWFKQPTASFGIGFLSSSQKTLVFWVL